MGLSFKLLLRLQMMIPLWCFRVTKNADRTISWDGDAIAPADCRDEGVVRVVSVEGGVQVYRGVVVAGEVMEKNPMHLLCRWDSLVIGQHVPPMAAGDELLPGNSYFLLPAAFFHSSPLSFLSLASISDHRKLIPAFSLQKTDSGKLRIVLLVRDATRGQEEDQDAGKKRLKLTRVCTTEALQKDYKQLVVCRRSWTPKLETIREYSDQQRRRRRSIRAFPGIRRRRKTTSAPPCSSSASSSSS